MLNRLVGRHLVQCSQGWRARWTLCLCLRLQLDHDRWVKISHILRRVSHVMTDRSLCAHHITIVQAAATVDQFIRA